MTYVMCQTFTYRETVRYGGQLLDIEKPGFITVTIIPVYPHWICRWLDWPTSWKVKCEITIGMINEKVTFVD